MTTVSRPLTTTIGSLPHHNSDAALDFSFRCDLPFLPQIPIRNSGEYMLPQALEGLPGLTIEKGGFVTLDINLWHHRAKDFAAQLEGALKRSGPLEAFEPSSSASSCWQPFLWELSERKTPWAKIQIAGPLTSQWALKLNDGTSLDQYPDLGSQIYRLVTLRAIAMIRRVKETGAKPVLFIDEPGLYGLSARHPKQLLAMQELKLMIQTLQKEGARVGLHCCSNTDWSLILPLGMDVLSLDTALSLDSLLEHSAALRAFFDRGSQLSLGVVPTSPPRASSIETADFVRERFTRAGFLNELQRCWLTPACGLALSSVEDSEVILAELSELRNLLVS